MQMLSINTNLMANNAALNLSKSYAALGTSVQRLSSGLRINSAADDAAGMAVSSSMAASIAILQQGSRNTQDAISMLQTSGGALGTDQSLLTRMSQLAEQSSTGTYTDAQRTLMNNEFQQDIAQITQNAQAANFNGVNVLTNANQVTFNTGLGTGAGNTISFSGANMTATGLGLGNAGTQSTETASTGAVTDPNATVLTGVPVTGGVYEFQFGAETAVSTTFAAGTTYSLNQIANAINTSSQAASGYNAATVVDNNGEYSLQLSAQNVGASAFNVLSNTQGAPLGAFASTLGTAAGGNCDISDTTDAGLALASVNTAINNLNTYNSTLGYMSNRLSAAASIVNVQAQNLQAAQAGITDVDTATETSNLTRNSVLTQAGIAMLAQANSLPQMALKLLQA
jgi:flagellin